jgi:PDZ domain-containing protein
MDQMVPPRAGTPGWPPSPPPARGRRLAWWLGGLVALLVAAAIGSLFVRLPYYALAPGSVRDTGPLIEVDGVETFAPDGQVEFTTVSVRGRLTVWGALAGWLDPAVSVVPEDQVLSDRTPEENRRINLQLMDTSKQVATLVALRELGYPVELLGSGALVVQVQEGEPADGVLEVGDTVVAVEGEPVELATDLVDAISSRAPGEVVELTVEPHGRSAPVDREVELGSRPDDPDAAFLGVVPQTRDPDFVFPFPVEIDTGSVGGPSAGLAFTLGLLDVLTPGELTGGERVAVTGSIDPSGAVGTIGGVEQKAAAVRDEGIDLFLVPSALPEAELAAARRQGGDEVEIVPVDTLDEALRALDRFGGDALALGTPGADES